MLNSKLIEVLIFQILNGLLEIFCINGEKNSNKTVKINKDPQDRSDRQNHLQSGEPTKHVQQHFSI